VIAIGDVRGDVGWIDVPISLPPSELGTFHTFVHAAPNVGPLTIHLLDGTTGLLRAGVTLRFGERLERAPFSSQLGLAREGGPVEATIAVPTPLMVITSPAEQIPDLEIVDVQPSDWSATRHGIAATGTIAPEPGR
jgi:hypothetical protein